MAQRAQDPQSSFQLLRDRCEALELQPLGRLNSAFRLAQEAHQGQTRSHGAPYLVHPVGVARVVLEEWRGEDLDLVCAALLHDAVEDSELTLGDVQLACGDRVRELVDLLTKPEPSESQSKAQRDEAYYARLAVGDPGARLIKAADRLDNLRDVLAAAWSEEKKRGYAQEALDHIVPLAQDGWPRPAEELAAYAHQLIAAIERGEADRPDVAAHELGERAGQAATGQADPRYRLSRYLSLFQRGPELFLYHDLSGDILGLSPELLPLLEACREARHESALREQFGGTFARGDFDAFFELLPGHLVLLRDDEDELALTRDHYPVHGPWILTYGLSAQDPAAGAEPGERPVLCYRDRRQGQIMLEELDPFAAALYLGCDGETTQAQLAQRVAQELRPDDPQAEQRALAQLRAWAHSDRQLLKLLDRPAASFELLGGLPAYARSSMPYERREWGGELGPTEEPDLEDYHRRQITSAEQQFDERETTLSHAFRQPHPALGGQTFGRRLLEGLRGRDLVPGQEQAQIVEVGGGVGFFAAAVLDGLQQLQSGAGAERGARYTIVDLAPALSRSQRQRTTHHAERIGFVGGDAGRLPLADESVDLLLCNEVIADLPVSAVSREELQLPQAVNPAVQAIRRFGLDVDRAPGRFLINTGALGFVEEIARVLAPGGAAYVSEYGSVSEFPVLSAHLDHPEHSIHFGHLAQAAQELGLEANLVELPALLGLDPEVPVLRTTQSFFATLRAFLAERGVALEKLAYTEEQFAELCRGKLEPERLQGLSFGPCGERVLGLIPGQFQALLLRRPRRSGRKVAQVSLEL